MCQHRIFRFCGLAAAGLFALSNGATAQAEQKSAKDLIPGTWTLLIADNVRGDGDKVPGFGPLPKGTAKFGSDGRYSLELMPNSSSQGALRYSGSYALNDSGKTLTLRVEESSLPNWRGATQTGSRFSGSKDSGMRERRKGKCRVRVKKGRATHFVGSADLPQ